jgi:hypothetical protein
MPVGLSDGTFHEDFLLMSADSASKGARDPGVLDPEKAQRQIEQGRDPRIIYDDQGNTVDYDLTPPPGMPPQAPEKPADALKPEEGTQPPGNDEKAEIDWSKMNQPFGSIKGTAPVDTPVVATAAGGIRITEGDISQAIDVAGSFGTGTMVGVKARTTKKKLSELGLAQILEQAGEHPDDIWKQTGFARGAEGRWRHEIDDSKSVLDMKWADNPTATEKQTGFRARKLPEVINHPELFEAYPHLKDTQIIFDIKYPGLAQWDGAAITVGKGGYNDKAIIMHEVQHAIQDFEGFAKGGFSKKTGDVEKDYKAWENYRRLAGEVESVNTEARLLLTEKERRNMAPWWTEDIKRRDQIVMKEAAEATHEGVYDPILKRMLK